MNLKARSFTLKPIFSLQTKTSCLCVGPCSWRWLQMAAHLCRRRSYAALTHHLTTSYFWHKLIQRTLEKQSACSKGLELMLKWSEIKPLLEQSVPDKWVIDRYEQSCVQSRSQAAGVNFQISLASPKMILREIPYPKCHSSYCHTQTVEVRFAPRLNVYKHQHLELD